MQSKRGVTPKNREEAAKLKRLGRTITEYASKRKVSIERLAYEAEVSKGYLYEVVKGIRNPSLTILYRIAEALEVTVGDLVK